MKRTLLLAAAGLLTVALVACGSSTSLDDIDPAEGVSDVVVDDNTFEPRVISIPAGTEVIWTWEGGARHNVVGDGGFQSELVREGTFSHVFDTTGTFNYLCTLHGGMTGRVIVVGN